jgi:hypothetical protein
VADFWADDADYKAAREAYEHADAERKRAKASRAAERERKAADRVAERAKTALDRAERKAKGKHRRK